MRRILAIIAAIGFVLTAFSVNAAQQCRDPATGKFIKCPSVATHCRNPTTGKYEKCPS
jgi:hypothetical protein